jgi:acetamidase/formamidase
VPAGPCGLHGRRTLPPRENGGNSDVKQSTKGVKLFLPVFVKGAVFSTYDGHFARGGGEACVAAAAGRVTCSVAVDLHISCGSAPTPRLVNAVRSLFIQIFANNVPDKIARCARLS